MRTLLLLLFFGMAPTSLASVVCETDDAREQSNFTQVGRVLSSIKSTGGCTGTLFGRSCMITAGHCRSLAKIIQFNVPNSNPDSGKINHSLEIDTYPVISEIDSNSKRGNDWAVFRIGKNQKTNMFPGDVQGFLPIDFHNPLAAGDPLLVAGYGRDTEAVKNYTQQSFFGTFLHYDDRTLRYRVDASRGVSGAAIVRLVDNAIVGIHRGSGCNDVKPSRPRWGNGTQVFENLRLQAAITECLHKE